MQGEKHPRVKIEKRFLKFVAIVVNHQVTNGVAYPPGMRRRSDVSFWSHLGWDVVDHIETSSRRRYRCVNDSDLFGTLSQYLTGT